MPAMTQKELADFIRDTVKSILPNEITDIIRENVEKSVAPLRQRAFSLNGPPLPTEDKGAKRKGGNFGTYVRALAAAHNDKRRAADIAKLWGYEDVATAISESESKAMTAGDVTGGGFLVPTQFATEVIELLRPAGAVRSLSPEVIQMPMGNFKIPKITSGTSASYVGESTNITKSEAETGQISLSFKKLAALVPMSNDLVRYSSPSADTIVRNDVVRALAAREDQAFIRDDGTNGGPKGLRYWIHDDNEFAANGTVSLANVTADLGEAIRLLMAANVPLMIGQETTEVGDVRPGWIFSPRTYKYLTTVRTTNGPYAFRDEMLRGTLWGWPFRVTSQVLETMSGADTNTGGTSSEVYFGGFAYAVIGEAMNLFVDASDVAAYHDGSAVVAAYSRDETVVRVISEHDFALRQDKGFSRIHTVTWNS